MFVATLVVLLITVSGVQSVDTLMDGGFEDGPDTFWWDDYTNTAFSTICSFQSCGSFVAHNGSFYAWFGGEDPSAVQLYSLSGVLFVDYDTPNLEFFIRAYVDSPNMIDYFEIKIYDVTGTLNGTKDITLVKYDYLRTTGAGWDPNQWRLQRFNLSPWVGKQLLIHMTSISPSYTNPDYVSVFLVDSFRFTGPGVPRKQQINQETDDLIQKHEVSAGSNVFAIVIVVITFVISAMVVYFMKKKASDPRIKENYLKVVDVLLLVWAVVGLALTIYALVSFLSFDADFGETRDALKTKGVGSVKFTSLSHTAWMPPGSYHLWKDSIRYVDGFSKESGSWPAGFDPKKTPPKGFVILTQFFIPNGHTISDLLIASLAFDIINLVLFFGALYVHHKFPPAHKYSKLARVAEVTIFAVNVLLLVVVVSVVASRPVEYENLSFLQLPNSEPTIAAYNSSVFVDIEPLTLKRDISLGDHHPLSEYAKYDFSGTYCAENSNEWIANKLAMRVFYFEGAEVTYTGMYSICPFNNLRLRPADMCFDYTCNGYIAATNGSFAQPLISLVQDNVLLGLAVDIPVTFMDLLALLASYYILQRALHGSNGTGGGSSSSPSAPPPNAVEMQNRTPPANTTSSPPVSTSKPSPTVQAPPPNQPQSKPASLSGYPSPTPQSLPSYPAQATPPPYRPPQNTMQPTSPGYPPAQQPTYTQSYPSYPTSYPPSYPSTPGYGSPPNGYPPVQQQPSYPPNYPPSYPAQATPPPYRPPQTTTTTTITYTSQQPRR